MEIEECLYRHQKNSKWKTENENLTRIKKISASLQKKFFDTNIRQFLQKFMKILFYKDKQISSRIPCLWVAAALAQAQ